MNATHSGPEFLHEDVQLSAELGPHADEVELAGALAVSSKQLLQQGVLAVLDQELQGGVEGIVVLLQELGLFS